ncbi:MAG: hypothetical protein M0P97_01370 [Candidatus Moranbacteria bacterium]|jgi:hypothetical protein|nr:hypothetical protein [Candidatus Moranbacteria bacterium]
MLKKKEFLITTVVAIICLVLIVIFPRDNVFQNFIVGISFFLIVPWLYIRIVLKESIADYGIQVGRVSSGVCWAIFSFVIFSLIILIASKYANFVNGYRLPQMIDGNFGLFVVYEVFLVGFFLFLYELFFHGWLLNFLKKYVNGSAVITQFAVFVIFLALIDNLNWTFFPYMVINLFGGWVVYRSHSIWYSFIFGWIAIILLDTLLLRVV